MGKIGKIEVEIKLIKEAYTELCDAFVELDEATEDMTWLNDSKIRMLKSIQDIRVEK